MVSHSKQFARNFRALGCCLLFLVGGIPEASALLRKVKPMPEPDAKDRDTITRVQILLDERNFGPGKIDGQLGQFTRAAVAHYNVLFNLAHDDWARVIKESKKAIREVYSTYELRERDFEFISSIPSKPAEQVGLKYLSYRTPLEFIAERFHSDEKFIKVLNPEVENWYSLKPGHQVRVPNVSPFKIEDIALHQHFGEDDRLSKRLVIVDTRQNLAAIWEGEKIVATFPVTPGREKFIHRGKWKIRVMVTTPEFRWDDQMLKEGKRGEEFYQLPPGPNSPVGIFWAGINKSGIGLHGTNSPHTIGRSQSAGCIRFANWDAIRLASLVRPGATVEMR